MSEPQPAGADLARIALHNARQAAKQHGNTETRAPRKRRKTAPGHGTGRDPQGLAAVVAGLMADRAWEVPAAGGTVLDQWPDIAAIIAPQLPDHARAVAFHAETGQLDLRPDSPAYATQLRLLTPKILAAVAEQTGSNAVRTLRVLPPGPLATPSSVAHDERSDVPADAEPPAEIRTRETASAGYREALTACQASRTAASPDPALAAAVEGQNRGLRAKQEAAFAHEDLTADTAQESPEDRAREARAREAAALRRARRERSRSGRGASA